MQTASGQVVNNSPGRNTGRARRIRRPWRPSPITIGMIAFLTVLSLGAMVVAYIAYSSGKPPDTNQTIAQVWEAMRTATPAAQRATELTIEKLGAPRKEGDNVVVRLRVTNHVKASQAPQGTPTPDVATPTAGPATVYNGTIRVFFYNEVNGKQVIVGSGYGNVTDLPYGQSKEIDVVSTDVRDFSPNTKYEAFADSVWTDKDPVKSAPAAGTASPSPTGTNP